MEWTCVNFKKRRQKIIQLIFMAQTLALFLLGPVFSAQAGNILDEQKLSITLNGVSVKNALEEIQRQTNLSFVYNEKDLKGMGNVSLNFNNKSVAEILDYIVKDKGLAYDITNGVIVIKKADQNANPAAPQAKKRVIKGKVTDDSNLPMPGVAVKVKGLNVGNATDVNGIYELVIDENPNTVLEFSFMGMKSREEKVGNRTEINVQLQTATTDLDEVMVVAYGTVKKESFTGSAVSVKGDDVIKAAASKTSPERALQGNVAGVRFSRGDGQPGGSASIQIRGIGSINESTEPLYIIDGVPMTAGTNMLNPDDIESMTVLKDAAATSLYGSRAASGVIVITTKQGKEGKVKFDATYERAWSFQAMPRGLDGYYMNSKELTDYSIEALQNSYLYNRDALPWQENYDPNNTSIRNDAYQYALRNLNGTAKIIHPDDPLDGSFNYQTADLSKYETNPRSYNWYDAVFRTGTENKVNLSARGGSKNMQYFASLGYVNQKGIARGSEFERYTGRISITNKASKHIDFSLSEAIGYSIWDQNSEGNFASSPVTGMRRINPTQPIYLSNGELNPTPGFKTNIPNYIQNLDLVLFKKNQFSSISNLNLAFHFTDWLTFRTVDGIDINYSDNKTTWTPESNDGKGTNGQVSQGSSKWINMVTSNTLNFNKAFADKHNVSALVGYEAKKYTSMGLSATGQNFSYGKLMYLSNAAKPSSVGGSEKTDRLISWIFKADYNYDNKYFFSASARRDGTSRLLKENRWGNFWSLSGAWNVTREKFMESTSGWLDNLRLKLSYGTNGTQPGDYFNSQTLYDISYKHNLNPASIVDSYGNPDLTWESSYTWNAGIDFSLWKNRLRGTIEYYNKHTKDLIDYAKVPIMSGWSSIIVNEGELRNTGVEVTLDSRNIVTDNFTWSTNFNISYMRAMVEKLQDDKISHPYITQQGKKLNSFYTREWVGVDPATGQGIWKLNTKDENGRVIDSKTTTHDVNEADRVIVGQGYPDWFGGLTNRFSYKGIELSFLLTFTLGGDLWDGAHSDVVTDGANVGSNNFRRDAAKHWSKPGDHSKNPIVINNDPLYSSTNTSTRRMMSSNHLRVKNITLSYELPKEWLKSIGLSSARLYVNGNDVLTFYKSKYVNPEVNMSGMATGVDAWPSLQSWRVGINIQF